MSNILIQAVLLVLPPFLVGFITVPFTNELASGDPFTQNCYLAGLRLIWTIFVLAFSKSVIQWLKNLF